MAEGTCSRSKSLPNYRSSSSSTGTQGIQHSVSELLFNSDFMHEESVRIRLRAKKDDPIITTEKEKCLWQTRGMTSPTSSSTGIPPRRLLGCGKYERRRDGRKSYCTELLRADTVHKETSQLTTKCLVKTCGQRSDPDLRQFHFESTDSGLDSPSLEACKHHDRLQSSVSDIIIGAGWDDDSHDMSGCIRACHDGCQDRPSQEACRYDVTNDDTNGCHSDLYNSFCVDTIGHVVDQRNTNGCSYDCVRTNGLDSDTCTNTEGIATAIPSWHSREDAEVLEYSDANWRLEDFESPNTTVDAYDTSDAVNAYRNRFYSTTGVKEAQEMAEALHDNETMSGLKRQNQFYKGVIRYVDEVHTLCNFNFSRHSLSERDERKRGCVKVREKSLIDVGSLRRPIRFPLEYIHKDVADRSKTADTNRTEKFLTSNFKSNRPLGPNYGRRNEVADVQPNQLWRCAHRDFSRSRSLEPLSNHSGRWRRTSRHPRRRVSPYPERTPWKCVDSKPGSEDLTRKWKPRRFRAYRDIHFRDLYSSRGASSNCSVWVQRWTEAQPCSIKARKRLRPRSDDSCVWPSRSAAFCRTYQRHPFEYQQSKEIGLISELAAGANLFTSAFVKKYSGKKFAKALEQSVKISTVNTGEPNSESDLASCVNSPLRKIYEQEKKPLVINRDVNTSLIPSNESDVRQEAGYPSDCQPRAMKRRLEDGAKPTVVGDFFCKAGHFAASDVKSQATRKAQRARDTDETKVDNSVRKTLKFNTVSKRQAPEDRFGYKKSGGILQTNVDAPVSTGPSRQRKGRGRCRDHTSWRQEHASSHKEASPEWNSGSTSKSMSSLARWDDGNARAVCEKCRQQLDVTRQATGKTASERLDIAPNQCMFSSYRNYRKRKPENLSSTVSKRSECKHKLVLGSCLVCLEENQSREVHQGTGIALDLSGGTSVRRKRTIRSRCQGRKPVHYQGGDTMSPDVTASHVMTRAHDAAATAADDDGDVLRLEASTRWNNTDPSWDSIALGVVAGSPHSTSRTPDYCGPSGSGELSEFGIKGSNSPTARATSSGGQRDNAHTAAWEQQTLEELPDQDRTTRSPDSEVDEDLMYFLYDIATVGQPRKDRNGTNRLSNIKTARHSSQKHHRGVHAQKGASRKLNPLARTNRDHRHSNTTDSFSLTVGKKCISASTTSPSPPTKKVTGQLHRCSRKAAAVVSGPVNVRIRSSVTKKPTVTTVLHANPHRKHLLAIATTPVVSDKQELLKQVEIFRYLSPPLSPLSEDDKQTLRRESSPSPNSHRSPVTISEDGSTTLTGSAIKNAPTTDSVGGGSGVCSDKECQERRI